MEGFGQSKIKGRPTDEPERIKNREEKEERAEMGVKSMFDENMEAAGIIRRIREKPYFRGLEER